MSNESKRTPLKRNFISLETKIQILNRLREGEKIAYVARSFNLNEATIRTIKKHEEKIRAVVAVGSSVSANMTARARAPIIEKMEKGLSIWIEDSIKKQIPLDGNIIKRTALKIYSYLRENGESPVNPEFVASKGWFERFKKRFRLQNMKLQGESVKVEVDNDPTKRYLEEFQQIIAHRGYTPHQVFHAHQTRFWWNKLPIRTLISKGEKSPPGFKASKDQLTLYMCSNASGEYMVKPMLICRPLNGRLMKSINKTSLPVYCKLNEMGCLTTDLFNQWFLYCFEPAVKNYLKRKNLEFKVLLLLDNAPGHSKDFYHPNVEILFFPPNTSFLFHPLNQGIVSTFKAHYIKQSLEWILEKMDYESFEALEAWKHFSIEDCIQVITLSLRELKASALNAAWKNVWAESVQPGNMIEPIEDGIDKVIEFAKSMREKDFDDMTVEDVQELLVETEAHEDNLEEITSGMNHIKSEDIKTEDVSSDDCSEFSFTENTLRKGIELAEELESYFLSVDPLKERSLRFQRELQRCLEPYREIFKNSTAKRRQVTSLEESIGAEHIEHKMKHPRLIDFNNGEDEQS